MPISRQIEHLVQVIREPVATYCKMSDSESTSVAEKPEPQVTVKSKRKQLRARITRSIKRIKEYIEQKNENKKRFEREIRELRCDFERARNLHAQLYDFAEETQTPALDKWENELANDVYSIEEEVEQYLSTFSLSGASQTQSLSTTENMQSMQDMPPLEGPEIQPVTNVDNNLVSEVHVVSQGNETSQINEAPSVPTVLEQSSLSPISVSSTPNVNPAPSVNSRPFDAWIDDLTEFNETVLPESTQAVSVADALYKLEASRDIPTIKLPKFSGNALSYADFIDRFKIHIHDKPHLTDDMRMIQLKMHVSGDAERAISGLGSKGVMYATALKILKEQFGQPSMIARSLVNRLTKGEKIQRNDRNALRELSIDLVNCIATLHQVKYFADVNTSDNLRKIIMRLPDYLIQKWKGIVVEIRDKQKSPTINDISTFLRKQVKVEFDPDFGDVTTRSPKYETRRADGKEKSGIHAAQKTLKCFVCDGDHKVVECPTVADSTVPQRLDLMKNARLCFSCLNKGHMSKECRSKKKCEKNGCTRMHHQLLHEETETMGAISSILDKGSILPVVRVCFKAPNGRIREGNVLIDSGAGTTVIRKDFARSLGLQGKRERINLAVVGGEKVEEPESKRVTFVISALNGSDEHKIEAHEIARTVLNVPRLDRPWLKSFAHLQDIEFAHKAGPVDLILGVQYSHLHAEDEMRQGRQFEPVAKRTKLGWFVMGADRSPKSSNVCSVSFVQPVNLQKFYEFETLGIQAPQCHCSESVMSIENKRAIELMEGSCKKKGERYEIGLPWKKDKALLPNNYVLAEKRLFSLERSLRKKGDKARLYNEVMDEYEKNGWSRQLSKEEVEAKHRPEYYLPHHGVYRPEKKTTPLRIVFDPACQHHGVSLNSFLYKGPCLIGNLLGVLLRFREDLVGLVGDISKMYLQILLPEEDTFVHRYLWRDLDESQDPRIYALQRVTFGDKPSPDMASFVMIRIANENEPHYPRAAVILKRDRYMDDLINSTKSQGEAAKSMSEVDSVLATGSFKIKEWFVSSSVEEVQDVQSPVDELQTQSVQCSETKNSKESVTEPSKESTKSNEVNLDGEEGIKTLGVKWNPQSDKFSFSVKKMNNEEALTKRTVLSRISRVFDPLGLASVITIKARVALQEIWKAKKYDWDDPLPEEICNLWHTLFRELEELNKITIPRCLRPYEICGPSELHVFADASATAYGAVAYLLWPTSQGPKVSLIAARARVAPLRQATIPRLELMAAVVASRLANTIYNEFKTKPEVVKLWSDSKIVLHWLRSDSTMLKAFVGVRVAEIQSTWESSLWQHVPSALNPADDLSRGVDVKNIHGRWFQGPAFLRLPESEWPNERLGTIENDVERKRPKIVGSINPTTPSIDPTNYSNWQRLVRITAYCMRFGRNARVSVEDKSKIELSPLQPCELHNAKMIWIREVQSTLIDWKDRYKDLAPFVENDVIRVGGRLKRASLPYDQVHPILLPGNHHVSKLIMEEFHEKVCHAGCERTLSESRREYWIISGRRMVKGIIKNCVICRKFRQRPHSTLMADLPRERVKPFSPPFTVTGVDLFGPFSLKVSRNKSVKAWGAIFTCATVRAIHLEVVESMSAEAFLHALRRFASHHGWPSTIISDNGMSFVGAERLLRELFVKMRKKLEDFATLHQLRWIFTTPRSPHQGGIYESLIKQVKRAIRVVVGSQRLSWNEMSTVFAEVKSLINGRPLGYPSNDPNDVQPLTPNHFLIGRASSSVPHGSFERSDILSRRFEFIQSLVQRFWERFIREYLPTLQKRGKWRLKERQMKIGDLVLMVDYETPRGKWKLARVEEVYPGKDGVVRNVLVKSQHGHYKRSVQRLCVLIEAS